MTLQLSKKKENVWKKKTLKLVISCLSKTAQQRVFFPPILFDTPHRFFIKAHATVAVTVFSRLSKPVEQFEVSHQAQLVWWQDLVEWNSRDAEQEPKYFLVKKESQSNACRMVSGKK